MKCLYIDLASNKGLLALVAGESVIAAEHIDQRLGDHELMPRVEALLRVSGSGFTDLTQVACVVGPGGFMSLRVAVALANTLADQLQIPIAGVHLSDVYAARMGNEENCLWLHSTKKTELFVRGFGDYEKQWPVAIHVMLEDFVRDIGALHAKSLFWMGELIPEHRLAMAPFVAEDRDLPLQR
ncbi:MAG: Glycoprotease family protein, partial [Candidatus Peregrinibacteria bacterium Greene0416_62]